MVNLMQKMATINTVATVITVVQSTVSAILVPLCLFIFVVLQRTAVLHRNLKLILLVESGAILACALTFLVSVGNQLASGEPIYGKSMLPFAAYGFCITFRNCIGYVCLLERLIATIWYRGYEHRNDRTFSIIWIIASCGIAALNVPSYLTLFGVLPPIQLISMTTFVIYTAFFSVGLFELPVFLAMLRFNKRAFKNLSITQHNLSERYQLAENIRTGKQLLPNIVGHLFNISISTVMFALSNFHMADTVLITLLLNPLAACLAMISCLVIELCLIVRHPIVSRNARQLLIDAYHRTTICCCKSRIHSFQQSDGHRSASEAARDENRNNPIASVPVGGESNKIHPRMIATAASEGIDGNRLRQTHDTKEHFEALRQAWLHNPGTATG